jgi:hypothetical protein
MNYDQTLTQLIATLGLDKGIPQPHRNAVVSSARRLQLEIRGALTMITREEPAGLSSAPVITHGYSQACECLDPSMPLVSCPVHGTVAS